MFHFLRSRRQVFQCCEFHFTHFRSPILLAPATFSVKSTVMDVNGFQNRKLKRHLRLLATRKKPYVHVPLSQYGFSNDFSGVREAPSRETRHEELEKGWSTSNVGLGLGLAFSVHWSRLWIGGKRYLLGAARILPSNICSHLSRSYHFCSPNNIYIKFRA